MCFPDCCTCFRFISLYGDTREQRLDSRANKAVSVLEVRLFALGMQQNILPHFHQLQCDPTSHIFPSPSIFGFCRAIFLCDSQFAHSSPHIPPLSLAFPPEIIEGITPYPYTSSLNSIQRSKQLSQVRQRFTCTSFNHI